MRNNKIFATLLVLVFESVSLIRPTSGSANDEALTGNVTFSSNRSSGGTGGQANLSLIDTDRQTSESVLDYKINGHSAAIMKTPGRNNERLQSLGDSGEFETDLSVAEGMEHMHIMKKKPKYKKVKMEVLEPKIKYKKIKMKYKKPVKKMKKKKVKGYIKAEKSKKMKKMKHYSHYD